MAIPRVTEVTSANTEPTPNNNRDDMSDSSSDSEEIPARLTMEDFPMPTRQQIMNCSYSNWHQKYKSITPKSRIIPLTAEFLEYLREDGIVLPRDENEEPDSPDPDWDEDDENAALPDPTERIAPVHNQIKATIAEFGGVVHPKLNWSAPKDASFLISNSLKCFTPSDIYLLFKSSDFITHDLEHAFEGTVDDGTEEGGIKLEDIQYDLVLRKWVDVITSVEFRCFVKGKKIVAVSQRDVNYYDFLEPQADELLDMICDFFEEHLQNTFPDDNYTFDVYIPKSRLRPSRVWLIDINPFAKHTDPLIYSWTEILNMNPVDDDEIEFRLVQKDDPEAYHFNQSQYSAYKLPKEVFDAGTAGVGSLSEFAGQWKDIVDKLEGKMKQDSSVESEESDEDEDDETKEDLKKVDVKQEEVDIKTATEEMEKTTL